MPVDIAQLDSTIRVVTPENIAFQYQVAGPFRRLLAFTLDVMIRLGVLFALSCLTTILGVVLGGVSVLTFLVGYFILDWFYGGLFETFMNGQTPGKWVLGIRVLTTTGQPINGLQAIARNLLRFADMMPLLSLEMFGIPAPAYMIPTFMVGLVFMASNRKFQRLGDLVCQTMVVIEERKWLTGVAKLDDPRAAVLAGYLPADYQISRPMARALAHYVERRHYFSAPRRREVSKHLAEPLLQQFGLPRDTSYDLLLCALYYRAFIADRGEESRRSLQQEQDLVANAEGANLQVDPRSTSPFATTTPADPARLESAPTQPAPTQPAPTQPAALPQQSMVGMPTESRLNDQSRRS